MKQMKVEIWSDVVCPFCYMGKRKFEMALERFEHKDKIEVEWKSYILNPDMSKTEPVNTLDHLAERKGMAPAQVKDMFAQITRAGKEVGLEYNFDKSLSVNTFDAHRFLHYAKSQGKSNEAEETLFRAHFTDGLNVADHEVLATLGEEIGLDADAVRTTLKGNEFAEAVDTDIYESRQIGVRGVPFFVLNRKYAVSGAQEPAAFLEALNKSYSEWREQNPELEVIQGDSCSVDGNCD